MFLLLEVFNGIVKLEGFKHESAQGKMKMLALYPLALIVMVLFYGFIVIQTPKILLKKPVRRKKIRKTK